MHVLRSVVNKFVELLKLFADADLPKLRASREPHAVRQLAQLKLKSFEASDIGAIVTLWSPKEKGVLLIDEVDMLLHPLRSELNFPLGGARRHAPPAAFCCSARRRTLEAPHPTLCLTALLLGHGGRSFRHRAATLPLGHAFVAHLGRLHRKP